MRSQKTLPIIGMAFGSLIILLSLSLILIGSDVKNRDPLKQPPLYEHVDADNLDKDQKSIEEKDENEEIEEETLPDLKESGWIPNWAFDLGSESLKENINIINTVMPVLYTVNSNGVIKSRGVSETKIKKLVEFCQENNIRVIPTIGSYDYSAMKAAFASPASHQGQIETILTEIEKYGFDGIDLDYEIIKVKQKENFLLFLKELSFELRKKEKTLSVTLFAQWDGATYNDHQETREVQDYEEIGKYASEVRIMAYDYTLQSSSEPGPIGPINWIRDILDYAVERIPKEKIWLGVHLYGYQWSRDRTTAFTHTTTESTILNSSTIKDEFKEDIGEGYAQFNCDDGFTCTAYFQTPMGIKIRREIAKEYQIAGISYWRLGGELDILQ